MAGRRVLFAALTIGAALGATLLVACSAAPDTPASPPASPPLSVTVDGFARQVAAGTTVGQLLHSLDVHLKAGRLLSVTGHVLSPRAFPGSLLLNGADTTRTATLSSGDTLTVVNGQDRTEHTKRVSTVLPGYRFGDPQFTLRTYRLKEVDTVGRVSGETGSVAYVPIGAPKVPREVALTFDDGPWPGQTRHVVRILKRFHVHATFFMIGREVQSRPDVARDVVRAGMTIGNHSWDHPQDPAFADLVPSRLHTEIANTDAELQQIGVTPFLFRPPGGSYDAGVVQEATLNGLRVVNWSVDPQDWRDRRTAKQIVHVVLSNVGPGSIVLMHDGGGDQSATIKALPKIIKGIRRKGLKLVAIPK